MEILVGRTPQNQQLVITVDGKSKLYGAPGSVPMSVSRNHHLKLTKQADGTYLLENKKIQNVTYVNGQAVVSKGGITERDRIELGADRYLFDWSLLKSVLPKMEDIRPLKRIYDDYLAANQSDQYELEELKTKMENLGLYGSLTGIFTTSALVLSIIFGKEHLWYLFLYIIPIAITIYIFKDIIYKRSIQLKNYLKRKYGYTNAMRIMVALIVICFIFIYMKIN